MNVINIPANKDANCCKFSFALGPSINSGLSESDNELSDRYDHSDVNRSEMKEQTKIKPSTCTFL